MLATEKNKDIIDQVKKLSNRIQDLQETKHKMFQYILKVQEMFIANSKQMKAQIDVFEETIIKKSFYSIGKCQNMKKFVSIYKHLFTSVEGIAKLNQQGIKQIDINFDKKQEKLRKKIVTFSKQVNQYIVSEQGYNKNFEEYNASCNKLNDMMKKSSSIQDPLNFYNPHLANNFSKNLQKKHHECENKQTSLVSGLQFLDEKRKILSQSLKEIQQDYLSLLQCHMANFTSATSCLTDASKDQINSQYSNIALQKTQGDIFNQQIQRFDSKYGKIKGKQDQIYTDLKELFKNNNIESQITSDQRLFLDRCQTFSNKKIESAEEFLYLQKRSVDQIRNQINNSNKILKQFASVEKNVFRSNGAEDFKKRIRKYFGQGIYNVAQLCFIIVDVPKRKLQKIGKMLHSYEQKLKKCIQKKQEQVKKLKKRISQILNDHSNAVNGQQNDIVSINQLKVQIQKTFSVFKTYLQQFNANESQLDKQFQSNLKRIVVFVERQYSHLLLKYTLGKQKQNFLFDLFKNLNFGSEIISIVKQDNRYDVLFNHSLKPSLFDQFNSLIDKKKFEETKIILHKKQAQSRGMVGEKLIGCCGTSNRMKKYVKMTEHPAILVSDEQQKQGRLQILNKGITFEEKKKNPFGQKVQILIPTKQIIQYGIKSNGQTQKIEVVTNMGSIIFLSEQINQISQSLQKNLGKIISKKQKDDSKRQKSSDSSSFFKQNNTSTEYKISYQKSILTPQVKSPTRVSKNDKKPTDASVIRKMLEFLKKSKVLSDFFVNQSTQETTQYNRIDYAFKDDFTKFLLKEKRTFKSETTALNFAYLNFDWKVSFPDMPMLKSFTHGQQIRVELTANLVKIIIIEKNRGESHLFVRKTFYNEVDKMNKKLSDLIVQICEREAQVLIQQQKIESDEQTIVLDVQNLALDKQQIQTRHGFTRMYSGSMIAPSQNAA